MRPLVVDDEECARQCAPVRGRPSSEGEAELDRQSAHTLIIKIKIIINTFIRPHVAGVWRDSGAAGRAAGPGLSEGACVPPQCLEWLVSAG